MKRFHRGLALLMCLIMALSISPLRSTSAASGLSVEDGMDIVGTYSIDPTIPKYDDYKASFGKVYPTSSVTIDAADYARYETSDGEAVPEAFSNYEGMDGISVVTAEDGLIEYDFTISEEGFYDISLLYYPIEGKNSEIQRGFFIDGALPYAELAFCELPRIWKVEEHETYINDENILVTAWDKDNQGNEVKPATVEAPEWVEGFLYDNNGYVTDKLAVYLTKGSHTITILSLKEPMLLRSVTFANTAPVDDYATVKAGWDAMGAKPSSGQKIRIEAENISKSSSQMLYPKQDQSSVIVYPSSPKVLLNNTLGGTSWQNAGQWAEWEFTVPETGYYSIDLFAKQTFLRGIDVYRRISIDGVVPFDEMNAYGFGYKQSWRLDTLEDENGEAYQFYLTEGTHTLRMEVVLGDMAEIIAEVQDCVSQLNNIYRQVICITGVSPDEFRDYQIEASIPSLAGELVQVKTDLDDAIAKLRVTAGNNSDKLTVLVTMSDQLEEFIEDEERFSEVLATFKTNVRACGNWIRGVIYQPLQLDRIYVYSPDTNVKLEKSGFFARLWYNICRLFYSFVIDYNQIGNVVEDDTENVVLTLWVGTGRDQANVIKSLIDEKFTPNTNISVNVQLVDMNTLLKATLAGEGPDVAIQVANTSGIAGAVLNTGNDTPVNYGLRNAVLDLTQFSDYQEIIGRFADSAVVPFAFNGATYALPDTQTFPMMFYRKDILNEIGLEIPKTWDEVKVAMAVLSKNQMEFGMLASEQIFAMLLYQNGGEYYTEGGLSSALDSDIAVNSFKEYCEYYTDYKLDKETSAEERFRTGECPIIISDYTTYNNLQVSAPDIAGMWDFTIVPGTLKEDGTIDHTTGATGLADIIMSATEYPEESWEFLKWWTSAETQTLYGREMEALMGASARVATANLEALASLSWPLKDLNELMEQLSYVKGIPQVPGGYYTWRNVNNAFYTVTTDTDTATPREQLTDKVIYINAEIDYKRAEFGLPLKNEVQEGGKHGLSE